MNKPRLIYYNDAHHFHAKRLDPPVSRRKLRWPVDEVLGTGVDLLVMGLGYGDVYFHDSKVGRVVGQKKEVWENFIDWRIMRMVEDARDMGTDQVREVKTAARENGLTFFPSLKLQDTALRYSERCGWLKWEHGLDVCFGGSEDDRETWAYDFTNELVRQNKLSMIREMLVDYETDGIELDFMFYPVYFRDGEVEKNIPTMTRYVAQIRETANDIGKQQGREIPILARVYHRREDNLSIGLDVETWLKEGSIDLVVGDIPDFLLDPGLTDGKWLADAANDAGAAAYLRPPRYVYDERTLIPHPEMYRAFSQNLHWQGFAGMYLGYLPWPFSDAEYQVLREAAYPEAMARRTKRYILQPPESSPTERTVPAPRQVPVALKEGETVSVNILVADNMESAKNDGEMRPPVLTIRFSYFCIEDDVEIRLNGTVLPWGEAQITDERALHMPAIPGWFRGTIEAPRSMSAHWFRYKIAPDLITQGENTLEVEARRFSKTAGFTRSLSGVEIQTRYKEFERPLGLEVDRVSPP